MISLLLRSEVRTALRVSVIVLGGDVTLIVH
jgi:hypothetical protein